MVRVAKEGRVGGAVDVEDSGPLTSFPVVCSITATRFAILTLSICAIEMMLPFPRTCVAALIVISGTSSSSLSSSSIGSYGFRMFGTGACGSTTVWYAGGAGMSSVASDRLEVVVFCDADWRIVRIFALLSAELRCGSILWSSVICGYAQPGNGDTVS